MVLIRSLPSGKLANPWRFSTRNKFVNFNNMNMAVLKYYIIFCGPTANAMSRLKDFPSIHDRIHTGYSNALHSLYEIGRNLSDKERQEVIAGSVRKDTGWRNWNFTNMPRQTPCDICLYGWKAEAESIPYFMLDKECWSEIVDALLVVYTSPS